MSREVIVSGLDVGTHTLKILTLIRKQKNWEVLCYNETSSFGLRKGAVVNVEETSQRIKKLISETENEIKKEIDTVFVNIGGNHLYLMPSDGMISVSRANQRISQEDVERVLQAAKAVNIPRNDEVLDIIPREYIIDGQKGIKEPVDLTGGRLEAKVLLLCAFSPFFVNLTRAVLNAGLKINDIIPSPLAAARAVLTPQQKELGVALIDIGASTTSLAVFEEGDLIHLAVFPLGSANITYDIAVGLKTDVETAENIKIQYGTCILSKSEKISQSKKKIQFLKDSSVLSFSKKELVEIIIPRVSEILELIQKELKKIGKQGSLPSGIVLTGGGAKIQKIKEFAKDLLELNCEIGIPKEILGLQEDPSLATVTGLALEGLEDLSEENFVGILQKGFSKIKNFFKAFLP